MRFFVNYKTDELIVVRSDGAQYPFKYSSRASFHGGIEYFKAALQLQGTYLYRERDEPADLNKDFIELL